MAMMSHVLGMPYQRFVNMPLWMKRLPMEFSYVSIKIMQTNTINALLGQKN
jgi:hypothetical protein